MPHHIPLFNMLKNDLLIKALRGEDTERTPVWMMRQAGRYLPDYRVLRDKFDFFTRVQTPELATAITLTRRSDRSGCCHSLFRYPGCFASHGTGGSTDRK